MSASGGRAFVFNCVTVGCLAVALATPAATQPAPQINAQDIVKTFSTPPSQKGTPCDRNSWVRGEDGAPVHRKCNTLGFNLGKETNAAPAATGGKRSSVVNRRTAALEPPPPAGDPTVNLLLTFNLDSAELTPQAMANVQEFAKAIQDTKLAAFRFQVEGYTDASGSRAYNMGLSKRRAESAVKYLVSLGIDPSRLQSKGFGPALIRPDVPNDEANRRVIARRAP
jgi:outer membrane protein OmpA-like peptidoglycan-associated protein